MMVTDLTINVNKVDLLNRLRENREKHAADYVLAHEGYVQAMREELQGLLAKLDAGEEIDRYLTNQEPENHTAEYDLAIQMFEMATDTEIELDSQQFSQYVNDDWGWKRSWSASNTSYITRASRR